MADGVVDAGEARLELRGIVVRLREHALLRGVDLDLRPGELVGLVGSSGSGKTLTCRVLLGMVDLAPGVCAGSLVVSDGRVARAPYDGILGAGRRVRDRAFAPLRGASIGYLPQDATASLDPYARVGRSVAQAARLAGADPRPDGWLERAGFDPADVARVIDAWPHQLSGGMAQRVIVAQALARGSRFLLADEPTTGLDAPVQRRVLAELRALVDGVGIGVLLVTHDLRALVDVADRIAVMDAGVVVETRTPDELRAGAASTPAGQDLARAGLRALSAPR